MRLSTSTNLVFGRPDGTRATLEETLRLVSEAGFRVFDLNFYDWSLPGSVFLTDGWEAWIQGIADYAKNLGVTFGQCHAYFYNFANRKASALEQERHSVLQERSLACCRILGAHTCVLHPETDFGAVDVTRASAMCNREHFLRLLDSPAMGGMRLAIENMCDFSIAPKRKFCAYPEELVSFVDSLGDARVGICWDFEHADIMEQDQAEALRYIGRRLYATHVSDTYSKTVSELMHVLPLTGTVDWAAVMPVLTEIGYAGDFSFEVHNFANRFPDALLSAALRLAHEVGVYLLSLA